MSLSPSCDLTPEENRLVLLDWPTWPLVYGRDFVVKVARLKMKNRSSGSGT